jgi:hypothetical protein
MQHPSSFGTHHIDLLIPDRLTGSEPVVPLFCITNHSSSGPAPCPGCQIAGSLSAFGQSQSFCGVFALYEQDIIDVWHMFGTGAEV